MHILKRFFTTTFVVLITFSASAFAEPTKETVKEFVTILSGEVIDALKNNENNLAGRQASFEEIFRKAGDVPKIARFVSGPAWRDANDTVKSHYVDVYREYMALTYASRITHYNNQEIIIQRISDVTERNILVNTKLAPKTDKNNSMSVIWQLLSNSDGTLKVTDLSIENISMALTQRAEFASFLRNNENDLKKLTLFLEERLNSFNK
ncbi:MAG: phospholipid transport system substrate-binding protein [Alphaproteobacteria bacterium]|jgi:phospholipid transport system substrate-binding protein